MVWDLTTGKLGIQNSDGIHTLEITPGTPAIPANGDFPAVAATAESYSTSVNPFDGFGMAIPAYATQVPLDKIAVGDLVCGEKDILGWVTGKTPAGLKLLDTKGMNKNFTPPKVAIMGGTGVLVVQSLGGLTGGAEGLGALQGSLLPLLMMSGEGGSSKLDKILPLMLLTQSTGGAGALGAMSPMLMMLMMSDDKGGSSIEKMLLPMMLMQGGNGGGNAMLPMMLAMMNDKGDDVVPGTGLPPLRALPKRY